MAEQQKLCEHRYLTSHGNGWVCADRSCGVGILSLALPLPMPLIERAFQALVAGIQGDGDKLQQGSGNEAQ